MCGLTVKLLLNNTLEYKAARRNARKCQLMTLILNVEGKQMYIYPETKVLLDGIKLAPSHTKHDVKQEGQVQKNPGFPVYM